LKLLKELKEKQELLKTEAVELDTEMSEFYKNMRLKVKNSILASDFNQKFLSKNNSTMLGLGGMDDELPKKTASVVDVDIVAEVTEKVSFKKFNSIILIFLTFFSVSSHTMKVKFPLRAKLLISLIWNRYWNRPRDTGRKNQLCIYQFVVFLFYFYFFPIKAMDFRGF
jgi:hypothetical protein